MSGSLIIPADPEADFQQEVDHLYDLMLKSHPQDGVDTLTLTMVIMRMLEEILSAPKVRQLKEIYAELVLRLVHERIDKVIPNFKGAHERHK